MRWPWGILCTTENRWRKLYHDLGFNELYKVEAQSGDWFGDEYWAGTDPTRAASVLKLEATDSVGVSERIITWQSSSNALYAIDVCTNLATGTWAPLADDLAGTPPLNVSTTAVGVAQHTYYRVRGRRIDR